MEDSEEYFNKRHIIRFSCEKLELLCEWNNCDVVERDMQDYIKHIESCHLSLVTSEDLFCHWKECEAFAETLQDLRRHILFHAFHTKIKCYGKNLQQRKNLMECSLDSNNRNIIPDLPDPLVCCWVDCTEIFENPEVFYRHVESHVDSTGGKKNMELTIKCLWQGCNKVCPDYYKVKDHLKCHTQEKLVACPTCGGMFASRTKFFDHIQRQTLNPDNDEKTYVCEFCSRKLTTERLLRDHARHHVNHYKCPYCDMTCPTPSGLQAHVRYRHSTSKPFSCQYCEYKGKRLSDLRKHLETHSTIPNFHCPFEGCNYASKTSTGYRTHLSKKHTVDKASKYVCHLCPKTFCRGHYLSKHLVKRHKFRWPSGHCRFRYHQDEDGMFRLQTVRYESAELSEALLCDEIEQKKVVSNESQQETLLCNGNKKCTMICNEDQQEIVLFESEDVDSPSMMHCGNNCNNEEVKSNEKQIPDKDCSASRIVETSAPHQLSGIPVLYCVQNEQSSVHSQNVAENMFCQTPDVRQQVILQIVDSDNKSYVTVDGSSVVLLNIPDTGNHTNDQTIQILG